MRSVLALSAFAFLISSAALADPAPGTIMKVTPPDQAKAPPDVKTICLQRYKMEIAGLGQLGARLNLTSAQQAPFEAWKKSMIDMQKEVPCPPPPMGLTVPAPKRVENEITVMSATLDGLRKELAALKVLYAALTPEQRVTLDGPMHMSAPPPAAPPASAPPAKPDNGAPPPSH